MNPYIIGPRPDHRLEKENPHLDPVYEDREIEINGMPWRRLRGVQYPERWNYYSLADEIAGYTKPEEAIQAKRYWWSKLFRTDLWFLIYFGLRIPTANHPFVVRACKEVIYGPDSNTLDIWAREHFKSTIITVGETIQKILVNPEERVGIFSHNKAAATSFLRAIKYVFETSDILKFCFPDILYMNPRSEAFKWSEEDGIYVRRKSNAKEATVEAHGLIEGMPTGRHYTHIVHDDIETPDMVYTPEANERLKEMFDMSLNLGSMGGTKRIVGTFYHHEGLLATLANKKDSNGEAIYTVRIKPATIDGSANGRSVLMPEKELAERRANRKLFYTQQLCNPTPQGTQALSYSDIQECWAGDLPKGLFKFMTVDPAGTRKDRQGDSWAMAVCGVDPHLDDLGASDLYILDVMCEPMTEIEAQKNIVDMYSRNGMIRKLGVEKTALSTAEIHVANALKAKGKIVSVERGTLEILRPGGREKQTRIMESLSWPLSQGKIHILRSIPACYRERLSLEMQKFPYWHDDFLDALAYQYDLMKSYRFSKRSEEVEERKRPDAWTEEDSLASQKHSWMYV
jgi:hypothetical protein